MVPVAALKVTPGGSVPTSERVGAGKPVAVTVNVPGSLNTKLAAAGLVIAGDWRTSMLNAWVASLVGSVAVRVSEYSPPAPRAGVPLKVAVLLALSTRLIPAGRAPI